MKESKGDVDGVWCKSSRIDNNYKFFFSTYYTHDVVRANTQKNVLYDVINGFCLKES